MMYEPLHLAWAAGIVDGEGSILLQLTYYKDNPSYSPLIRVEMTHEETISRLRRIFGCGGSYSRQGKENWKATHTIQVNGRESIHVAKRLLPYLVTKRRQAELIIQFSEQCQNGGGMEKTISPEVQTLRTIIYDELKLLNRKGA